MTSYGYHPGSMTAFDAFRQTRFRILHPRMWLKKVEVIPWTPGNDGETIIEQAWKYVCASLLMGLLRLTFSMAPVIFVGF